VGIKYKEVRRKTISQGNLKNHSKRTPMKKDSTREPLQQKDSTRKHLKTIQQGNL
jgi:hypothetical protein